MSWQTGRCDRVGGISDSNRLVITRTDNLSVGGKLDRPNPLLVCFEVIDLLVSGQIPNANRPAASASRQCRTVLGECDGMIVATRATKLLSQLAALGIVNAKRGFKANRCNL